jgi:hypothetical protein
MRPRSLCSSATPFSLSAKKRDKPRGVTPKSLTTVVSPEEETCERVQWQRAREKDASR